MSMMGVRKFFLPVFTTSVDCVRIRLRNSFLHHKDLRWESPAFVVGYLVIAYRRHSEDTAITCSVLHHSIPISTTVAVKFFWFLTYLPALMSLLNTLCIFHNFPLFMSMIHTLVVANVLLVFVVIIASPYFSLRL